MTTNKAIEQAKDLIKSTLEIVDTVSLRKAVALLEQEIERLKNTLAYERRLDSSVRDQNARTYAENKRLTAENTRLKGEKKL